MRNMLTYIMRSALGIGSLKSERQNFNGNGDTDGHMLSLEENPAAATINSRAFPNAQSSIFLGQ